MTTASTEQRTHGDGSSAKQEGRRVAGVAQEEAGNVAAEAKNQVTGLLDQARSQAAEQGGMQRDRLVQTLTTLGDDLQDMAEKSEHPGMATDLARQAASRVRDLSDRLDGREPSQILDDVRGFARRRPGTFLLGALAAGVIAGRLTRGAKESRSTAGSQTLGTGPSSSSSYPQASDVGDYSATASGYPASPSVLDTSRETVIAVDETPSTPIGDSVLGTAGDAGLVAGDIPHDRDVR